MDQPLVSVIVPVHNTEPYLPACLDSILAQTLSEIEVLCIDDGSTDGCPKILRQYAAGDERVRVLDQPENSRGPGAARNLGISEAHGTYVAFVDSDDTIDRHMLERLTTAANQYDAQVAMCMIEVVEDDGSPTEVQCSYDRVIPANLDGTAFTWRDLGARIFDTRFSACNKIYRRSLLEQENITFAVDQYYEDMTFSFQVWLRAQSLCFVREPLYLNRRDRPGATTFEQGDRVFDAIAAMSSVESLLGSSPEFQELLPAFHAFRFKRLLTYLVKNDADHIAPFYDQLQSAAARTELEGSTLLSEQQHAIRDQIREKGLHDFLVWYVWHTETERHRLSRRFNVTRTRQKQVTEEMRSVRDENRRLQADNQDLSSALTPRQERQVTRRRLRTRIARGVRRVLGPRATKAPRRLVRGARPAKTSQSPTSKQAAPASVQETATKTSKPKKPKIYKRASQENLYDGIDFLRQVEVDRTHGRAKEAIRGRLEQRDEALHVGFVVSAAARWNGDSLLAEINRDPRMTASIFLCPPEGRVRRAERDEIHDRQRDFFGGLDAPLVDLTDPDSGDVTPIEDVDADVLFFEMPWGMMDFPRRVIGRSLPVYMHYGFMMMANHEAHYNIASFHSYLWAYFTQTEGHRRMHLRHDPSANGRIVVTGYPKLDVYATPAPGGCDAWDPAGGVDPERPRVIYAPHHALGMDNLGMSTFRWSGDTMRRIAQEHPGTQWLYKPHPTLRFSVVRNDVMSAQDYDDYEQSWVDAPNGAVHDSGGYFDAFRTSDALITCSGSFLAEYLPTGKPIIWLVSDQTVGLNDVGERLARGFYRVHDPDELESTFQKVVIDVDDPLAPVRAECAAELFPTGPRAGPSVIDHLRRELIPDP